MPQDAFDQRGEGGRPRQVGAVAGEINAGQHDFAVPGIDERGNPVDHRTRRDRTAVPPPERNRAEGATMVAAVLHLDERTHMIGETRGEMRRGRAHGHDVLHLHWRRRGPRLGQQFFGIADHAVDLGHRREASRVDLCRAAGDRNLGIRMRAPRLADRRAGFGNSRIRHSTTVDDHQGSSGVDRADRLAFGEIEAAAETDDDRFGGECLRQHWRRSRRGLGPSPPQPARRAPSPCGCTALFAAGRSRRRSASSERVLAAVIGRP